MPVAHTPQSHITPLGPAQYQGEAGPWREVPQDLPYIEAPIQHVDGTEIAAPPEAETLDIAAIRERVGTLAKSGVELPEPAKGTITHDRVGGTAERHIAQYQIPAQLEPAHTYRGTQQRKIVAAAKEGVAGQVYAYLGERTPKFIKKHVPVYRAVGKRYAGLPGLGGASEWTIGAGAKAHALKWVENNTYNPTDESTAHMKDGEEYVAIRSTLGELQKSGNARVTHYGDYGATSKKVVLQHATVEVPVRHKVIQTNKHSG